MFDVQLTVKSMSSFKRPIDVILTSLTSMISMYILDFVNLLGFI